MNNSIKHINNVNNNYNKDNSFLYDVNNSTENFELKPITNITYLNNIINVCNERYGKVIDISLPDINIDRITDLQIVVDNINNVSNIKLMCISKNRESTIINIDTKTWNLNAKIVNMNDVKIEQSNNGDGNKQTLEEALSDPNYTYYRFDNGLIARTNNKGLYFKLNSNNELVRDQNIISLLEGTEYAYEIIDNNTKGESR